MSECAQQVAHGASSFWSRQFSPDRTGAQIVFDVTFGIAMPTFCLYFDPIVFRTSFGEPLLSGYDIAAGGIIGISMLSLVAWLSVGRPAAFLWGVLAAGALFAAFLGIVLLPFSVLGLFLALIGLLGFMPFMTAFVFLRNAVGAFRRAHHGRLALIVTGLVGMAVAGSVPCAAQHYVTRQTSRAIAQLQSADPAAATEGLAALKRMRFLAHPDKLVNAYGSTSDPAHRERLASAYKALTGADIEDRAAELWDD